jgi:hypothetical protein
MQLDTEDAHGGVVHPEHETRCPRVGWKRDFCPITPRVQLALTKTHPPGCVAGERRAREAYANESQDEMSGHACPLPVYDKRAKAAYLKTISDYYRVERELLKHSHSRRVQRNDPWPCFCALSLGHPGTRAVRSGELYVRTRRLHIEALRQSLGWLSAPFNWFSLPVIASKPP